MPIIMPDELISYVDCNHFGYTELVCAGQGTPHDSGSPHPDRYDVRICSNCGQFHVLIWKSGVVAIVEFTLGSQETVDAAGRYLEYISQDHDYNP